MGEFQKLGKLHFLFHFLILVFFSSDLFAKNKLCEALLAHYSPGHQKLQQLLRIASRRWKVSSPFWENLSSQFQSFSGEKKKFEVNQDGHFIKIEISALKDQLSIKILKFGITKVKMKSHPEGASVALGHLSYSLLEGIQKILDRAPNRYSSLRIEGYQVVNPRLWKTLDRMNFNKKRNWRVQKALSPMTLVLAIEGALLIDMGYWLASLPLTVGMPLAIFFLKAYDYNLLIPLPKE